MVANLTHRLSAPIFPSPHWNAWPKQNITFTSNNYVILNDWNMHLWNCNWSVLGATKWFKLTIIWSRSYVGKPFYQKKKKNSLDMALRYFFETLSECTTYLDSNSEQLFRLVAFLKDIPQITIDKIHITSKDFHSYSTTASLSQDATRNRKCIMGKIFYLRFAWQARLRLCCCRSLLYVEIMWETYWYDINVHVSF